MNPADRRNLGFLSLLFFASGAAALCHQVVWTRRLVDVLGASSGTFSQVIGAFFAGLAIGAWWMARRPPLAARGLQVAAIAELAVGLLAVPALFGVDLAEWMRPVLGTAWLKRILVSLLVVPPAVAMGMVMPAAVRGAGLAGSLRFYGANTLGGVAGIAATIFGLFPVAGITHAGLVACASNVGIALGFLSLHRSMSKTSPSAENAASEAGSDAGQTDAPASESDLPLAPLAFASGALVLGLEVIFQHQISQVAINSTFASAGVLFVVLLALFGATAVSAALAGGRDPRRLLGLSLGAAALICATQPTVFLWLRPGLIPLPYTVPPGPYAWRLVLLCGVVIVPALFAAGTVFPLVLREVREPSSFARVLAWNGIGGWIGSEAIQDWLAPQTGLWGTVVILGGCYGVIGVLVARGANGRFGRRLSWASVGVAVLAFLYSGTQPQAFLSAGERLVSLGLGREGVVGAVSSAPDDWRILFNNTYTLGGSRAAMNQERQAHLPLLLHGAPRTVALLGVATGSTLAGAVLHRDVERIDAAELSPLALGLAKRHFTPFNRDAFRDSRVTTILEDARWLVKDHPGQFDVVIGDLFLPWRTGEGRLYSIEHFMAVRHSLRPGGLFCQWLPLYQLTPAQFDTIARTFRSVFPEAFVVRGDFYSDLPIVGLIGGRALGSLEWERIDAGAGRLREDPSIRDPLVRHVEGVAMMVLGALPAPAPGPVNTLGNNWLEWDAARNVVGLQSPWFIGVPAATWMQNIHRATQPLMPEPWRLAHDAGQFFLTLDVAVRTESPYAVNLRSQIAERLPEALRRDQQANWRQWPSREKPAITALP